MIEGTVVLPSAYLAPISYYCRLLAYRNVLIEQCEHYIKQTYRNRCVIATESGPLSLTSASAIMAIGAICTGRP